MVAKITVILFAMVCLVQGVLLILVPWINLGFGDWGNNQLLALVVEKTNLPILRTAIASSWVRGAITGIGVFNLIIAFWEIANFKKNVAMLEGNEE